MFRIKKSIHLFLIAFTTSCLLIGCGSTVPEKKPCKYKPPVAIFEGINAFKNHSFELNGQESVERIFIPDMNMEIELYQSGCDFLEQEYRILLKEPYPLNTSAEICAVHISNIFLILSQKAPKELGLFQQWAAALQADAKLFEYNEKLLLQGSDIHAQIDKTHDTESAVLSIVFSQ